MIKRLQNLFSRRRTFADIAAQIAALEDQARTTSRRALACRNKAIRIAARHGLHDAEAHNSYQLGLLLRGTGASQRAEAALVRATEIWEADGNALKAGDAHLARAGVCLMDRRVDAAQAFADHARAHYKTADALVERPQLIRLLSAIEAMRAAQP